MKNILLLLSFILMGYPLMAQNTETLIKEHIEAIGGEKNWQNINTFQVEGSIVMEGVTIYTTKNVIRNKAWRNDMVFEGKVQSFKNNKFFITILNEKGWKYLPDSKDNKPEELVPSEITVYKEEMDFEDPFIGYKEKGTKISFVSRENILNRDYDKFSVTYTSGKQEYIYLNAGDHMIAKRVLANGDAEDIKEYGNYIKLDCGIYYPNYIRSGIGEIYVRKVTVNQPIPETLFENTKH